MSATLYMTIGFVYLAFLRWYNDSTLFEYCSDEWDFRLTIPKKYRLHYTCPGLDIYVEPTESFFGSSKLRVMLRLQRVFAREINLHMDIHAFRLEVHNSPCQMKIVEFNFEASCVTQSHSDSWPMITLITSSKWCLLSKKSAFEFEPDESHWSIASCLPMKHVTSLRMYTEGYDSPQEV